MNDTPDDPADSFELTPEQEQELLEAIAEADRGETVSADEVLRRLRALEVSAIGQQVGDEILHDDEDAGRG